MTLLTTQEERDMVATLLGTSPEMNAARRCATDCNTLIGLLREARGFLVYFTDITRPVVAGFSKGYPIAADLLSRIDKEIGDG